MNEYNQREYERDKKRFTEIKCEVEPYAEHIGKYYYAYYKDMPRDKVYLRFTRKYELEYFLYRSKIEAFLYLSSNGEIIEKIFQYKNTENATKEREDSEEKYDYSDFLAGHFIKLREEKR
jgi:hypothetical protein